MIYALEYLVVGFKVPVAPPARSLSGFKRGFSEGRSAEAPRFSVPIMSELIQHRLPIEKHEKVARYALAGGGGACANASPPPDASQSRAPPAPARQAPAPSTGNYG
ncbi:hypothetical protein EVAR_43947_1 [Eumeta japonica]|uniref:Uncharacterized protein n=1 Tax=Eumeta variegata TaxID=151549 RepID=A0A4C1XYD4_EUMVA|nr:hypothetical protein EVAR_43947_1 [Eumeta japonica]